MEFKSISEELSALKYKKSIEREMEDYFESKGFSIIEPDIFQNYDDFLLSNFRHDSSKTVKVLGGDSKIFILRPDITSNILGKILSRWEGKPPLKVYYNSRVYSNSPGGGIKESYQVGVESLGDKPIVADTEILEMAITLMESLKTPYVLELGSSKYLDSYIRELKLNSKDEFQIRNLLAKKNKDELINLLKKKDIKSPILDAILDMEGNMEEVIQKARRLYVNYEMEGSLNSVESLMAFFKERDLLDKVNLDLSMIPDLDYYDGIVFKGYCQGTSKKVISGGRYDKLTEMFGRNVSAVGFMIDLGLATQLRYRGENR
ncbi:hypothetical protein E9840_07990 [Tissierella creatinini]|nr:hypothetical protein E9840_07990 [Tissierella creatinini]TJX66749.1 hypothetical protein E8P77_07145 [Soehngenia saccharolytica]